jgi:DNA-binding NarL/FixJ family response regulator
MRILIVGHYALLRDGLGILIREVSETVETVQAETLDDIACAVAGERFDLALLDLDLPEADSAISVGALRARAPELPVVVIATSERWTEACAAIDAGARGYIPKSASSAIMIAAVRLVLSGGVYVPPLMGHGNPLQRAVENTTISERETSLSDRKLTPRQQEVLNWLARGHSNKQIAQQLGLSEGTVKIHIAAILRAYQVNNRTQAVIAAGALSGGPAPRRH